MGRSSVAALITRGKNRNEYNNTGIDSNGKWVDAFNAALQDLVSDINLVSPLQISFVQGTREYKLPADYFELQELWDGFGCPSPKRRFYDQIINSLYPAYTQGYYISFKGSGYVIDLYQYNATQTFNGIYVRYPALLTLDINDQYPEIPTIGEDALIDYAIATGLRNNNLLGPAATVMGEYEATRKKIRDAAARAMIGGVF